MYNFPINVASHAIQQFKIGLHTPKERESTAFRLSFEIDVLNCAIFFPFALSLLSWARDCQPANQPTERCRWSDAVADIRTENQSSGNEQSQTQNVAKKIAIDKASQWKL